MHCHFPRQRKFEFKSGRDRKTDMHTKTTMLICFQNFRIFSLVVERSLDDSYITIFSVVLNYVSKTYRAILHSRLARNVLLPLQENNKSELKKE